MNTYEKIITRLLEIIALEDITSIDQLGSYIVGLLIVDDEASKLTEGHEILTRIANIGSDLETSNGSPQQLTSMWTEVKSLTQRLV